MRVKKYLCPKCGRGYIEMYDRFNVSCDRCDYKEDVENFMSEFFNEDYEPELYDSDGDKIVY